LTLLASNLSDKPITLISLVDPHRQWIKSKVGLDAQETSRDIAFCAHVIHQQAIFSSLGLHITIASSGEEAMDSVQQQKFD